MNIPSELVEGQHSGSTSRMSEADMLDFVKTVGRHIYRPIAKFEIKAWRTCEPVSFSDRFKGEVLSLEPGQIWGRRLFDCAWFRFRAVLPLCSPSFLVARIDINGELYIADENGDPVRGLTCKESGFERKLGTPGKTIYRIPLEAVRDGVVELWADAGFNDLFGNLPGEGRIEVAEVCVCNQDVRDLYYDLEVLVDYWIGLQGAQRDFVEAKLRKAEFLLRDFDAETVLAARKVLVSLLGTTKTKSGLQVSAIGHAHLDLAWLWPIRETIRKGARTFATALYNLELYPEYRFGASQPQLFAWMKAHYPALYGRIRDAVKAGRIELQGTFWVEPDCNIPSGESFVRQILQGARFFHDEFGIVPRFCWEPDTFGYNGQLPQILKKSGHDYFMTQKLSWNIVNRFPHHSFSWQGIDGTSIPTHMLPEETYGSPAAPHSLRQIANDYAQRDVSSHALLVFGIGDGGGGPDAEHIERLRRVNQLEGLPWVCQRSAAEFFQLWEAEGKRFPTWTGELYLERHQGTLTTQALTKRNNRLCEIGLRELEWAAVLAQELAGVPYPSSELDSLWKEVLLYQFHDILPGSSIKRVYDECNARQAQILVEIEDLIKERYQTLAGLMPGNGSGIVFNSLPWDRTEWVPSAGRWQRVTVPGMGWAPLAGPDPKMTVAATPDYLENEWLRVRFSPKGALSSVFDKQTGREVLAVSMPGNDFVILNDEGDAWDFAFDLDAKDVWIYLRQAPERPILQQRRSYVEGPCAVCEQTFSYSHSTIHQRVVLRESERLLEFKARVTWLEPRKMLRVQFPVAVQAGEARFEIPFGSIRRSTGETTLVERAQLEVPAQQWVDLSDEHLGVTLLNDCKYGFRVKGNTLDMCLIRSVPYPGNALIGKDNLSGSVPDQECTDLGKHQFRYGLLIHPGAASEAEITQRARAFNTTLRTASAAASNPKLNHAASWITLSNPGVEISSVKQAEAGSGWIIRLINITPSALTATLSTALPFSTMEEVDLAENPVSPGAIIAEGTPVCLDMAAFEIKTLLLKPSANRRDDESE